MKIKTADDLVIGVMAQLPLEIKFPWYSKRVEITSLIKKNVEQHPSLGKYFEFRETNIIESPELNQAYINLLASEMINSGGLKGDILISPACRDYWQNEGQKDFSETERNTIDQIVLDLTEFLKTH